MHLRFESAVAGTSFSYAPGDVVVWPDEEEAARFCERGIATELLAERAEEAAHAAGKPVRTHRIPRPEAAARQPAEQATRPVPSKR